MKIIVIICFWISISLVFIISSDSAVEENDDYISVDAGIDKAFIAVGDKINYVVTLRYSPTIKILSDIASPQLETIVEISDVKEFPLQTNEKGDTTLYKQFVFVIFQPGEYKIEGQRIKYIDKNRVKKTIQVNPVYVVVKSVIGADDTSEDIKMVKEVVSIEANYTVVFIVGALLLMGLVVFCSILLRKYYSKSGTLTKEEVVLPLNEETYKALDVLRDSTLVAEGKIKEYYFRLVMITKNYLARLYDVPMIDKTTSECIKFLKKIAIDDNVQKTVRDFMVSCDIVKFAKYRPPTNEIMNSYLIAKTIVGNTWRIKMDQRAAADNNTQR
ncbi:MAG: hypothetical protein KKH94_02845 [Candidatus Omnitrophica bacterium]|nr:hypothetical protein [Candidatus Omnitrophota bacterium]